MALERSYYCDVCGEETTESPFLTTQASGKGLIITEGGIAFRVTAQRVIDDGTERRLKNADVCFSCVRNAVNKATVFGIGERNAALGLVREEKVNV